MARTDNPFQTVLQSLLEELFDKQGVNNPLSQSLPAQQPSLSRGDPNEGKGFNSPFSQQIRQMQDEIEQRIANPVQPRDAPLDLFQALTNQQETPPKFSPTPSARPDPNAPPPAIRAPGFRPNLPANPLGDTKQIKNEAQPSVRIAQAGPVTMTDAPPSKPLQASPELVDAVIQQESGGNAKARSPKGAIGLMQILPSTALDPGFGVAPVPVAKLTNAAANKKFGTDFLSAMLNRYNGDTRRALVAFNAGPGFADQWDGNVATLPTETQDYVAKIEASLGTSPESPAGAQAPVPGVPTPEQGPIAPQAPSAGRAVAPAEAPAPPVRPERAAPVTAPPLPDVDLGPPGLAQNNQRRPIVPVIWQQAVAKFQQTHDPKDLAAVPKGNMASILALMGRTARRTR